MEPYLVPDNRRYWVVRAEGGVYYQNFIEGGLIAIGHLDELSVSPSEIDDQASPDALKDRINKANQNKDRSVRQVSVSANQALNFIFSMNPGDWVITVSESRLRFGLITGPAYLSHDPHVIYHDSEQNHKTVMDYKLRRPVSWGPTISRDDIPYGLQSTLRANQTVFNADKHLEAINHTLYPAFVWQEHLYLSIRIRTKEEIKNQSMVELLSYLNKIEFIGKQLDHVTIENIHSLYKAYLSQSQASLTTKAQYHSPGDIWAKIQLQTKGLKGAGVMILVYGMLFGNSNLGMDGIIDIETRQKVWDIVIKEFAESNIAQAASDLNVQPPKYETKRLETMDNALTEL